MRHIISFWISEHTELPKAHPTFSGRRLASRAKDRKQPPQGHVLHYCDGLFASKRFGLRGIGGFWSTFRSAGGSRQEVQICEVTL